MSPCLCTLLQQASVAAASRPHRRAVSSHALPFQSFNLRPTSRQLRRGPAVNLAHSRTVQAAATAEVGKLIAKSEIPAFIPRQDLMDQLTRWAYTEVQEESMRKFGLAVKVSLHLGITAIQLELHMPPKQKLLLFLMYLWYVTGAAHTP